MRRGPMGKFWETPAGNGWAGVRQEGFKKEVGRARREMGRGFIEASPRN